MSKNVNTMRIADRSGDTTVTWDVDNEVQVKNAQEQFEALVQQGYQAFAFKDGSGQHGEVATTFDPTVKRYAMMPQFVGG